MVVIAVLIVTGCDEGRNMVGNVIDKPINPTTAEVIEVSYYLDADFTEPLMHDDKVGVGETIYTKVVFSKEVLVVIADASNARPRIFHNDRVRREDGDYNATKTQYRIKPRDADLQSGEAKLYKNTDNTFICKYVPRVENLGSDFFTFINNKKFSYVELFIVFNTLLDYQPGDELPVDVETITDWNPKDFTGLVSILGFNSEEDRFVGFPAAGATVTVVSGPRTGENTLTDNNGRYLFLDVGGDELHLRVEKQRFEPKEVIVHRSRPTVMPDGAMSNPLDNIQRNPGGILIGYAWPDEVLFILEEMQVVPDLLYFESNRAEHAGFYGKGVCRVSTISFHSLSVLFQIFAHELTHAHQHAVSCAYAGVGPCHGSPITLWLETPEGKAYVVARNKDLEEFGRIEVDSTPGYGDDNLLENAATIAQYYWAQGRWENSHIKKVLPKIPNRLRWAQEWLHRRYEY